MIGDKRHRITLQRNSPTNQLGQLVESWSDISTRWASIHPLSSKEIQQAQQVQAQISHEIRIRYDATLAIRHADRIVFGSRIFNIDSVINDNEMNVEYIIKVIEKVQ